MKCSYCPRRVTDPGETMILVEVTEVKYMGEADTTPYLYTEGKKACPECLKEMIDAQ